MSNFTFYSSETVIYKTEIKADNYTEALEKFNNIYGGDLEPVDYEGFQLDRAYIENEEKGILIELDSDGIEIERG